MARGHGSRGDPDEDPDSDDVEEEERKSRRPSRRHVTQHERHRRRESVRRWRSGEEDEEEEAPVGKTTGRPRVFWRARDSLYFEPLVALAIVVVLLVGLYAYTQNWPPVYVVQSSSMQHGSSDVLGIINTGDLVLAQKVPNGTIVPYVVGMGEGYSTYGEYGDVLLYQPNGGSGTPIIHRAILFLVWNPASRSYSAPDLEGLPCGNSSRAVYATPGTPGECRTTDLTGTLDLYRIGWMSVNVSLNLAAPALGEHSGFLTMGDNNYVCTGPGICIGEPDQGGATVPVISTLVEPGWVVGVARGMIPWFGALKLLLAGQAGLVPSQSWQFLGLTIAGIILLAVGIHYALRVEGIETPLRKEEEEEERESEEEDDEEETERRGWLRSLRPWHRSDDEEDKDDEEQARSKSSSRTTDSSSARRGRPRPRVKPSRKERRSRADKDDDL